MNLSIVIPAHNEADNIGALLESLVAADTGTHALVEILVYDDASNDATAAIVESVAAKHPVIRLLHGERRTGCTGALLRLYASARGEAIVRADSDVAVCDSAIRHLADAIEAGAALAIAAQEPLLTRLTPASLASSFALGVNERLKAGELRRHYAVGHFLAYARDAVVGMQMPEGIINEDHYTAMHVFRAGGEITYVPQARCKIHPVSTFADYWRASRRVLEGERQLRRMYGMEPVPLLALLSAVLAHAVRRPLSAACWALFYTVSSSLPSPVRNSAWEPVRSTKGRIA
jgi:glycosyltransferase involved in cell wall biosynthesis